MAPPLPWPPLKAVPLTPAVLRPCSWVPYSRISHYLSLYMVINKKKHHESFKCIRAKLQ